MAMVSKRGRMRKDTWGPETSLAWRGAADLCPIGRDSAPIDYHSVPGAEKLGTSPSRSPFSSTLLRMRKLDLGDSVFHSSSGNVQGN